MCGCKERRGALVTGAKAVARGDVATAAAQAGFVVRTGSQDARAALARSVAAVRAGIRR